MPRFCVPYISEGMSTPSVAFFEVDSVDKLFPLIVKDFFDYEITAEDSSTLLQSDVILEELSEEVSPGFYEICSNYGVDFGEPINLDLSYEYVCTEADFQ
jgi:hypothetical protein